MTYDLFFYLAVYGVWTHLEGGLASNVTSDFVDCAVTHDNSLEKDYVRLKYAKAFSHEEPEFQAIIVENYSTYWSNVPIPIEDDED